MITNKSSKKEKKTKSTKVDEEKIPKSTDLKTSDAQVEILQVPTFLPTIIPPQEKPNPSDIPVNNKRAFNPYRVANWLPSDQIILNNYIEEIKLLVTDKNPNTFAPVIQNFKKFIEETPEIYMLFNLMFTEVPKTPPFDKNPAGGVQVRNYIQMLELMNLIITRAPLFNTSGLVGFPINAILDWSMGTTAGFAAFLDARVNAHLKLILNEWGKFLKTADSRTVLNNDPHTGWFGIDAQLAMPGFLEDFKCNPSAAFMGFSSWDDFFTREFKDGKRPVASPDDDNVIVNACESAPYKLEGNIQKSSKFWIKAQPYSLEHMMNHDEEYVDMFVGGTIYQAFLSALSYHRWHSPVSGTIKKTAIVDGTYYSEALSEGYDPSGPNDSQGYITELATRALIFIEADNPNIGMMCFMAVGMAEVSSCQIIVKDKDKVKKGDQLGMFHFGGSTHCLFFRKQTNIWFELGQTPSLNSTNINVRSKIATVFEPMS